MFKQAAAEPWTANRRRLRPISLCESEHLELLSYNTSDISKYGVDIFNKIFTSVFS
jgi:hypothetical protein